VNCFFLVGKNLFSINSRIECSTLLHYEKATHIVAEQKHRSSFVSIKLYKDRDRLNKMDPTAPNRRPNIVIIGAGIGGLALAIALLRQNIPYTLYESASEYSTVGAGVGLGPNALSAMTMIDSRFKSLYDVVATGNQSPDKKHVIFDVRLCEPGLGVDRGWKGEGVGHECYTRTSAHRKDLLDIMAGLIPRNTVKFGKKVADMKQIGSSVAIVFSDGEIVEASAVIGCDGVKGVTREAVLGPKYPEQVAPTYSGRYVYRAIVPMKEAERLLGELAGDGQCFMGKGRNFLCYPISGGREFNVVAFVHKDWNHEDMTRLVSREEMLGDFEGCDERLLKLLDVSSLSCIFRSFNPAPKSFIFEDSDLFSDFCKKEMGFELTDDLYSGPNHSNGPFGTTSQHPPTTMAISPFSATRHTLQLHTKQPALANVSKTHSFYLDFSDESLLNPHNFLPTKITINLNPKPISNAHFKSTMQFDGRERKKW
jgi:2-polyprenyl-6-methoxyphenol hydroxylase-like FAD-dependent oxidoreductase